jgi:hypothetical protein
MRRLNVQFGQIEECIRTSLFAIDALPRNPPLQKGEPLLLQLVKDDAVRLGCLEKRIEFALIFERAVPDPTGERSREHWPKADKTWRWILECSETVPTVPFSLENLRLSKPYGGQSNPQYIEPADEALVRPLLKGGAQPAELRRLATMQQILATIHNYDTIVHVASPRTTEVMEHRRRLSDPWLGDALKTYYKHRCQICLHDFTAKYGVPYADTRFLVAIENGGKPVSRNTIVLCPNHNAIVGAARAEYDAANLLYVFPNGVREELTLRDHLL